MLKSGNVYKLGDGPINYNWNLRYFVLDEENQEMTYYQTDQDVKPTGIVNLADALVSNITLIKEREHSFSVQAAPPGRTIFLSTNTEEQSVEWREAIIAASVRHKQKLAQASFQNKLKRDKKNPYQLQQASFNRERGGGTFGEEGRGLWRKDSWDESNLLKESDNEGDEMSTYFEIDHIRRNPRNTVAGIYTRKSQVSNNPFKVAQPRSPSRNHDGSPDPEDEEEDFRGGRASEYHPVEQSKQEITRSKSLKSIPARNGQKDLGSISQENAQLLNKIQKYIQSDVGSEEQGQKAIIPDVWETIKIENGVQISALNPKTHKLEIDKKKLVLHLILLSIVAGVFFKARELYEWNIGYFWLGLIFQFLNFKQTRNIVSIRSKYSIIKGRVLLKGDPIDLGREYLKSYPLIDVMTVSQKDFLKDEDGHTVITDDTVDLPSDFLSRALLPRRSRRSITYWGIDDSGAFYVLRSTFQPIGVAQKNKKSSPNQQDMYFLNQQQIQEAMVFVPISGKSEKSMVYFFSDFNYHNSNDKSTINPLIMNTFVHDSIKEARMNLLSCFVEHVKAQNERKFKDLYKMTSKAEQEVNYRFPDLLHSGEDQGKIPTVEIGEAGGLQFPYNSKAFRQNSISAASSINQGGDRNSAIMHAGGGPSKKTIKENPLNIYIKGEQRLGISDRFPGYFRMENGALWCHNQEELAAQSGIIFDLLQRAGKKLMEGRGIVAVSLPVRIFEKRSTIEKICDLWCTGPIFLKRAALQTDPIERMKNAITFVVSGMHMVATQRKPFNPILGETYQGVWPDGSKLFVEHISHHPPISTFLVENVDGLFKFQGSYEYTARVTDLGNSVTGRQAGKNKIFFQDDTFIEFEYPIMKITGLIYGRRTTQWVGGIEFTDKANSLHAKLEFSAGPGFFNRQQLPIDCLEGILTQKGREICKIQGSWLEFIRFDDKLYWELETCDTVRPVAVEHCLPSDCRQTFQVQHLFTIFYLQRRFNSIWHWRYGQSIVVQWHNLSKQCE